MPFLGSTFVPQIWEYMVIFWPRNLYSRCSPGNQDYQKIIHLNLFHQKKFPMKVVFLLELVVIINESWYNHAYIFFISEYWSPISTFFLIKKINNFRIMLVSRATMWILASWWTNYHIPKCVVQKWVRAKNGVIIIEILNSRSVRPRSWNHNFCRITSRRDPEPWCWTTDPNVPWEYCGIPNCSDCIN